jgi:hypothetical protein
LILPFRVHYCDIGYDGIGMRTLKWCKRFVGMSFCFGGKLIGVPTGGSMMYLVGSVSLLKTLPIKYHFHSD